MAMTLNSIRRGLTALAPLGLVLANAGQAQDLAGFAVISGQSLTNTGPTTITGNIAISPGTSYTGSGSVTQTGSAYIGDAVAGRIQNDLTTLYNVLAGRPTSSGGDLTGQDLGGLTLMSGVYNFDTSAGIAAGDTLTLDGGGDPDSIFIINVGTTLTANSGSRIELQNGAQGGNVFFRVGSSATLDTTADLVGQIVALTSITLNTGAIVDCGAVFARNGSVTLDTNTIGICTLDSTDFDDLPDDTDLTDDESAVVDALDDYVDGGGVLPLGYAILVATQTPDELADSLSQLTGQVSTGVAPMVLSSVDGVLDLVLRSGRAPGTGTGGTGPTSSPGTATGTGTGTGTGTSTATSPDRGYDGRTPRGRRAPRDEGVPIGMVPDKVNAPYIGKYGSEPEPAPVYGPSVVATKDWNVWVSGFGSRLTVDGDADAGSPGLSTTDRGLALGVNFAPSDAADLGVAVAWDTADFAMGDDFGSGSADTVFVALHGRTTSGPGYVEAALAFGQSDITTDRTLTIAGIDRFTGETKGSTTAAHIEAGYRMGRITPFAGLRAKSVRTDAYSETTVAGSSSYALHYDAYTAKSLRSELGVALNWPAGTIGAGGASFGLRAAWAHEFADNAAATRSFISVPDAVFPVSGTEIDRNSVVVAANMTLAARNGFVLSGSVSAEYSRNTQDLSGSLLAGYRW